MTVTRAGQFYVKKEGNCMYTSMPLFVEFETSLIMLLLRLLPKATQTFAESRLSYVTSTRR